MLRLCRSTAKFRLSYEDGSLISEQPKFFRSFNSDPRLQFLFSPRPNVAGGFFVSPRA